MIREECFYNLKYKLIGDIVDYETLIDIYYMFTCIEDFIFEWFSKLLET